MRLCCTVWYSMALSNGSCDLRSPPLGPTAASIPFGACPNIYYKCPRPWQEISMTKPKRKISEAAEVATLTTTGPLVFISHDARDAELAEAFSKLLKSVSAGMIKTFVSSDKKGNEGIDFGDEWYKRLM